MDKKIFVDINGRKQGMFLESTNVKNPVLLFLHGGPGSPEIAFSNQYPTGLEKLFTVCWWEQRGSCISYSRHIKPEEMTVEQMIADAIAVVDYLKKRFQVEKVYVMGHSWGTILGMLTVQRAPELFYAYIGVGQVANQSESERMAYTFMLQEFQNKNDIKMLRRLRKYPIVHGSEISLKYMGVRSEGMMKLGIGVMHHLTSMRECVMLVLRYKEYTIIEKFKFAIGSSFSLKYLWDFVMHADFIKLVPRLEVPVYIFHGKFDYQVSYIISKKYIQALQAPLKGFYTFEHSAHSPCFEEPDKMCDILKKDVLAGKSELADPISETQRE